MTTLYRVAFCPAGTAAVVSDRSPGPAVGMVGSLPGWRYAAVDEKRLPGWPKSSYGWVADFDDACELARAHNLAVAKERAGHGD